MNVYSANILGNNTGLTVANPALGYKPEYLYDESLSNNVLFAGSSTVITASWGINQFADTVALLDCGWTIGRMTITSQGTTVFDQDIASRGKNTILKLPGVYMISRLTLAIHGVQPLALGILWVGKQIKLPRFSRDVEYTLQVSSAAGRSRYGIVYGLKKPVLKSFTLVFHDIDNPSRMDLDAYIETVQYVQPHLVEPYETEEFPPVYATLADAGSYKKEDQDGFRWSITLHYREAR